MHIYIYIYCASGGNLHPTSASASPNLSASFCNADRVAWVKCRATRVKCRVLPTCCASLCQRLDATNL